jgi:hypothetical protein
VRQNCRYLTWSYSSVTEDDEHAIGAWMPRNDVGFQRVTVIGQCPLGR